MKKTKLAPSVFEKSNIWEYLKNPLLSLVFSWQGMEQAADDHRHNTRSSRSWLAATDTSETFVVHIRAALNVTYINDMSIRSCDEYTLSRLKAWP